jgi:hypothetical protein
MVHYDMGFPSNVLGIQNGRAVAVYTLFGLPRFMPRWCLGLSHSHTCSLQ